jgi:hypothetical protein
MRCVAGIEMPVLCPQDALAYASLHLLKHLLRGSVSPFHVYEIACILESLSEDESFWLEWRGLHSPELRRLEAVAFRLAMAWFGCRVASLPQEEIDRLPRRALAWFRDFATSPALRLFHPQKDELWLHLSLLNSGRDRWSVARRRLLPGNLPPHGESLVPESRMTWARRMRRAATHTAYFCQRLWHHAISLPRAAISGTRFWLQTRG